MQASALRQDFVAYAAALTGAPKKAFPIGITFPVFLLLLPFYG
jgi:hypothetical protein